MLCSRFLELLKAFVSVEFTVL